MLVMSLRLSTTFGALLSNWNNKTSKRLYVPICLSNVLMVDTHSPGAVECDWILMKGTDETLTVFGKAQDIANSKVRL